MLTAGARALKALKGATPQEFVGRKFEVIVAMHFSKVKILAAAFTCILSLAACAGTAQEGEEGAKKSGSTYHIQQSEKQAMLEQTFADLLASIRSNVSTDSLLTYITDTSEYWLDTLEYAAKTENEEQLLNRKFCEIYAILRYRIYEREHLWEVPEDRMLALVLAQRGILERLTELKLGPMEIKNDRGSVGLASSPKVPVLLFVWDDVKWELDLRSSLPLVTKGFESIGVKKEWTNTKLSIYLLEKEFRYDYSFIDKSLYEPMPSIAAPSL